MDRLEFNMQPHTFVESWNSGLINLGSEEP
ncbi:hypothetical protein Avbf_18236 [Armadillidium vulgare]|nr:hypothetical protein Avbf_18236 [Armadillidium vulgare]